MSAVTHTGDSAVPTTLLVAASVVLLIRRDRIRVSFVLATATIVRIGVLLLVHRPRPVDRLTAVAGFSYPSDHTTSSAVAAGITVVLGWELLSSRWSRVALAGGLGA